MKPSTRQRFVALDFDYPPPAQEAAIIAHESGAEPAIAQALAAIGLKVRHLHEHGLDDGVGTRALVHAGKLIRGGIDSRRACDVAIARALTEDADVRRAITDVCDVLLP
jgi:nitric oxide reductase NorQ protein